MEVHYDNMNELKEKMVFMYENIDQYDKKFISKFAQERFSEKAIYRKLKNVYSKIGRVCRQIFRTEREEKWIRL